MSQNSPADAARWIFAALSANPERLFGGVEGEAEIGPQL
jgi:hypothetical protein